MAVFQKLLKRFTGSPTPPGEDQSRFERLEMVQERHVFIDVKCPRLGRSFQSLILAINANEGDLILDEFFPPEGSGDLLEGDALEITSRSKSIAVSFYSRLLAREFRGGAPIYRVELPENIGISRNRQAYRVYVASESDLFIQIPLVPTHPAEKTSDDDGEENLVDGHIINLSFEGIKLDIDGDVARHFERAPRLQDCRIHLPDGQEVICHIDIRSVYPMRTPNAHTLIGGRLSVPQPNQRTRLTQYLAAVQRAQRRREMRSG
ncbi:MAG: flagellar brake protein [Spongiibacteraceae bacterium]|nr:flagellar brake protein [Spongiibacteraceae bacterium]